MKSLGQHEQHDEPQREQRPGSVPRPEHQEQGDERQHMSPPLEADRDEGVDAQTDGHTNEQGGWRLLPDGSVQLLGSAPWRQRFNQVLVGTIDTGGQWLVRHWLLVINSALGLFVGIALLVPVLYAVGAEGIATPIFRFYHLFCDQLPSHSYFFFGYQLALCSRNLAIFGSLLAGTLAFRYVRQWWPQLRWPLWLLTVLPMALDGGTQLFGWRESNWELRTLTGVIFGLGICWVLLPALEDAATPEKRDQKRRVIGFAQVRLTQVMASTRLRLTRA